MNDRDALFAAILAHPDEDTPRLVYADWLEEHGEPEQAAFIREQIELANVPEWDPLWIRAKYLDPDAVGGKDRPCPEPPAPIHWGLLTGDEWSGPFRRGFPSAILVFDGAAVRDGLADLVRVAPVDTIIWYGDDEADRTLPHWSALINDPVFARVRSLRPALVRLTDRDIHELHDSPHAAGLTELDLITCDLTHDQTVTFLGLPRFRRLRKLGLRAWDEGTGDVLGAAAAFTDHNLDSLHVHCGVGPVWDSDFLLTPLLCGLRELDLTENRFGPAGARQLVRSPAVIGLECLRLWWCQGGDELANALAGCSALTSLRQLELYGNRIGPKGVRALAESPYLSDLRVLDIGSNPVGDDGVVALAGSPHLKNLLDLNLLCCGVGDAGARALLDSPLADSLVHLELRRTEVSDKAEDCSITEPVARRLRERFGNRLVLEAVDPPLA